MQKKPKKYINMVLLLVSVACASAYSKPENYQEEQQCRAICKLKYPLSEMWQRRCDIDQCGFTDQPNRVNVDT
ncbi:MAG: hypothetical protein WC707_05485 [Candidatus Babeliaceae bacterium]|jgi:hypothetical protein